MNTDISSLKYCLENYVADPSFRSRMQTRPQETLQEHGILPDTQTPREDVSSDTEMLLEACCRLCRCSGELRIPEEQNRYLLEFRAHQQEIMREYERRIADDAYADRRLLLWSRQVRRRCRMENRQFRRRDAIQYYPLFFELSDGCSVQCPFCGVDAPLWKSDFAYTPENAGLWREILQISVRYLGRVAGAGACYMATEPFDNPDYERFIYDFRAVTGLVPQTTTAVADRCPERIRAFMEELGPDAVRNAALRFSIRSLSQLRRIQEIYRPEELKDIELLANNPESLNQYSLSGKGIRLRARMGEKGRDKFLRYGICCTAGLRVNMVRKTMEFLEPELPSEMFPNGYRIRETRTFTDAKEFETGMRRLFETWALPELPEDAPLQFNGVCRIVEKETCIEFWGDGVGCSLAKDGGFREAIRLVSEEPTTLTQLYRALSAGEGDALRLWQKFQYLYERGYVRWA